MNNYRSPHSPRDWRRAHLTADHAVIAILEGLPVIQASMKPADGASGWPKLVKLNLSKVRLRSLAKAQEEAKSIIRALLAGPASQGRYSFGDYRMEFNLAGRCMLDQEAVWRAIALASKVTDDGPALIYALWDDTMDMIGDTNVWTAVKKVAAALLDNRELRREDLTAIVRDAAGLGG